MKDVVNGGQLVNILAKAWIKEKQRRSIDAPFKLTYAHWLSFVSSASIVDRASHDWFVAYRDRLDSGEVIKNDDHIPASVFEAVGDDGSCAAACVRAVTVAIQDSRKEAVRTEMVSNDTLKVVDFTAMEVFFSEFE